MLSMIDFPWPDSSGWAAQMEKQEWKSGWLEEEPGGFWSPQHTRSLPHLPPSLLFLVLGNRLHSLPWSSDQNGNLTFLFCYLFPNFKHIPLWSTITVDPPSHIPLWSTITEKDHSGSFSQQKEQRVWNWMDLRSSTPPNSELDEINCSFLL